MAWLVGWLWRHGRRGGLPEAHDDARDDVDARQLAVARRLRVLQAQASGRRRPPRNGEATDD
jgi:hypothetical protein